MSGRPDAADPRRIPVDEWRLECALRLLKDVHEQLQDVALDDPWLIATVAAVTRDRLDDVARGADVLIRELGGEE